MFKYLIASLPIQTILTFVPELFLPKLNEIVQSNLQDESSRLYIRKTAYIAKKIAELAYKIYGFCAKIYTFQDLDMAEFQKTLSWTKESSKDLNAKVAEMDAELSNGGSLFINPESYQHLADERQVALSENLFLREGNSKLLAQVADLEKQNSELKSQLWILKKRNDEQINLLIEKNSILLDTNSKLLIEIADWKTINEDLKIRLDGNNVRLVTEIYELRKQIDLLIEENNDLKTTLVGFEQDTRSTNVTDNAFANVCATEEGENK